MADKTPNVVPDAVSNETPDAVSGGVPNETPDAVVGGVPNETPDAVVGGVPNETPPDTADVSAAQYRRVTLAFDFDGKKIAIGDVVDCSQWPNTEAMVQVGILSHDVSNTPDGLTAGTNTNAT